MNSVTLIGRLIKDPELRYLQTGQALCKFTLAVPKNLSKQKKQEMEQAGKYTSDLINIVVWGKPGENCANYLAKGRQCAVQGRIETGSYVAQDGTTRYTFDINADNVEFLGGADKNQEPTQYLSQDQYKNTNSQPNTYGEGFSIIDDDDIPF